MLGAFKPQAIGLHGRGAVEPQPQAKQHALGGVDHRTPADGHQQVGLGLACGLGAGHHVLARAVRADRGVGAHVARTERLLEALQGTIFLLRQGPRGGDEHAASTDPLGLRHHRLPGRHPEYDALVLGYVEGAGLEWGGSVAHGDAPTDSRCLKTPVSDGGFAALASAANYAAAGVRPANASANVSRSMLPPLSTRPTRFWRMCSRSLSSAASAAAPAPSATLWVSSQRARMAAAISSSPTRTMRAAPRRMMASASSWGTRQAMPSAKVLAELVGTGRPASNDRATAGASSATTPTISVSRPNRSRTVIRPQIPDPMPMGT